MRLVSSAPHNYRLFFYDHRNHIERIENIVMDADWLACERAQALWTGHPIEIWEAARLVARIESDGTRTNAADQPAH